MELKAKKELSVVSSQLVVEVFEETIFCRRFTQIFADKGEVSSQ